jgi:hypothetical protein
VTYLLVACGVLLALVFATSAASKLRGRTALAEFTAAVGRLGAVGADRARVLAVVVAAAEALVAVLFAVAAAVRSRPVAAVAFACSALLLAGFTVAIVAARRRGEAVPCRCFGPSRTPLGPQHVVRNAVLLLAAGIGLAAAGGASRGAADPAELAVAAGAGLVLALLVIATDEIVFLFQPARARRRRP